MPDSNAAQTPNLYNVHPIRLANLNSSSPIRIFANNSLLAWWRPVRCRIDSVYFTLWLWLIRVLGRLELVGVLTIISIITVEGISGLLESYRLCRVGRSSCPVELTLMIIPRLITAGGFCGHPASPIHGLDASTAATTGIKTGAGESEEEYGENDGDQRNPSSPIIP